MGWLPNPEENDTAGWVELDLSALDPGDETDIPFRLIANRYKSSSVDSEDFLHDPLQILIRDQGNGWLPQGVEIGEDWTVTTFVVNHHRTLSARHLYAMAAVNSEDKSVGISIVKKRPDTNS